MVENEANLFWAEAQLAAAEARWPEALAAFEALAGCQAQRGFRWGWARNLMDWAATHVARGKPADLERARALLRDSQGAFEEMGIPRYAALVEERLQSLSTEP
jgi:hypothetical protein